jgi:ubiquinone/menaquinone biosynthesis C-methylase UbiE
MKSITGRRVSLREEQFVDAKTARFYDEHARRFMGPIYRRLAARAARLIPPVKRVLDLGTGSGRLATELAKTRPDWRITGTDISEEMLKLARQNAARRDLTPGIDFVNAPAAALPFVDDYFDLVVSNASLHLWTDPIEICKEIERVLAPGGYCLMRDNLRLARLGPVFSLIGLVMGMNKDQRQLWMRAIRSSYTIGEAKALLRESPLKYARVGITWLLEVEIEWRKAAR